MQIEIGKKLKYNLKKNKNNNFTSVKYDKLVDKNSNFLSKFYNKISFNLTIMKEINKRNVIL
jgi:hypothetical protein